MEPITLKHTDLRVSRLCFGTMTFGKQTDEAAAARIVDRCLDAGVNFFDTANVYNRGESERILGRLLKGRRGRVVLASKVSGKMGEGPEESGLSPAAMRKAIDESLRRLDTDCLDIYYLHMPDYEVPLDDTLDTLERLVREGKVRYPAHSNYASWQAVRLLWLAEKNGWRPAWIAQVMYNLLARGVEQEFMPMCKEFGVSTVMYNPLAGGLLTGKHQREKPLPGTRFEGNQLYLDRYWHPVQFDVVDELREVAARSGRTLVSLALTWMLHHTAADCVILGASRPEQLEENLKAAGEGALPADVVAECDRVWDKLRGVTPKYNR